jgi:hypothetical protein
MAKKNVCPLSAAKFLAEAKSLTVTVMGVDMVMKKKHFSTGGFGWYLSGKEDASVCGEDVQLQIGFNVSIIGSKDRGEMPGAVQVEEREPVTA